MGNLSWHDAVRLYLNAGGLVLVAIIVRLIWMRRSLPNRRWREVAAGFAVALPVADGAIRSLERIGLGPFDDPHRIAVLTATLTLALFWLAGEVRLVPPWNRGRNFPHRDGEQP